MGRLDGGGDRLVTRRRGYQLTVLPGELDVAEFEELAERGHAAVAAGEPAVAAEAFASALELWQGRPFENLEPGPVLRAERTRLEERHLLVVEALARARISLGEAESVTGELRRLLAEQPAREELASLLMRALHASGRRAEALEVFTETRLRLVNELGIEPGRQLREAHQDVLAADPGGEQAETEPRTVRQLPTDIADFTGREAGLEAENIANVINANTHTVSTSPLTARGGCRASDPLPGTAAPGTACPFPPPPVPAQVEHARAGAQEPHTFRTPG